MRMMSPVGEFVLQRFEGSDMTLHICPVTGGIWVDVEGCRKLVNGQISMLSLAAVARADELSGEQLAAHPFREPERAASTARRCPVCGHDLRRVRWSRALTPEDSFGVDLDVCAHGTWFDKHEVRKIVAWVREKREFDAAEIAELRGLMAREGMFGDRRNRWR